MNVKKILVPVSGDKADDDAVRLAVELAKKNKAKIYLAYVIEVERTYPVDAEIRPEMTKAEEILDHAERLAEEEQYEAEAELLQAREAGPAIIHEAAERGIDLIIMGFSYKRRFGEFSLGSTLPYVMRNAPCRVLVNREPAPVIVERRVRVPLQSSQDRDGSPRTFTIPSVWTKR